jgi:hypothetical protein
MNRTELCRTFKDEDPNTLIVIDIFKSWNDKYVKENVINYVHSDVHIDHYQDYI